MPDETVPRIEPASERDLPEVRALLAENRLPLAGVEECLDGMRLARSEGRIVGLAALEIHGSDGLLRSVVVGRQGRGAGLGARLVAEVKDLARSRRVRRLYLLTETAEGFFRRLGFAPLERRDAPEGIRGSVEFASACPASAVLMEAPVSPSEGA